MVCKNCNAEMPDNARFCGTCGAELEPEAVNPAQDQNYNEKNPDSSNLSKSDTITDEDFDKFLEKWNWGAFLFTWLWGIFNKSFNTFIALIPVVGLFYCFVCGAKGSRWSWKNKAWISKDAFIKSQNKWKRWGIIILIINMLLVISSLITLAMLYDWSIPSSASNSLKTQLENNIQQDNTASTDNGTNNVISDLTNRVQNFIDADNIYVQGVKNSSPDQYPGKTYGDAFTSFFGNPTWDYFDGISGEKVVEFSGLCIYQDVEVKAVLQFVISQDEKTFTVGSLSFNDVPQDQLTTTVLFEEVFSDSDENAEIPESDLNIDSNGSAEKINLNNTYVNDGYGFRVQYPAEIKNVTVKDTGQGDLITFMSGNQVVLTAFAGFDNGKSYEDYFRDQKLDIRNASTVDISGAQIAYLFNIKDDDYLRREVFCYKNYTWYELSLHISYWENLDENRLNELITLFDEMVKTFSID